MKSKGRSVGAVVRPNQEEMTEAEDSSSPPPPMASIDRTLHALGFQYTLISPGKLTGRLKVTETCCQVEELCPLWPNSAPSLIVVFTVSAL